MPGGRGRKKTHKGGHRHFTNAEELKKSEEKVEKEKEWKRRQGLLPSSDEESGEEEGAAATKPKDKDDGIAFEEEESSSEESGEEKEEKPKGVSSLIEVENPNRLLKKSKKVEDLDTGDGKPQLSRKQREEVEKVQAKERYRQLHIAGKTDEARADLARLALIRKQREDASKKRDVEKQEKDKADKAAEAKLREKRAGKQ